MVSQGVEEVTRSESLLEFVLIVPHVISQVCSTRLHAGHLALELGFKDSVLCRGDVGVKVSVACFMSQTIQSLVLFGGQRRPKHSLEERGRFFRRPSLGMVVLDSLTNEPTAMSVVHLIFVELAKVIRDLNFFWRKASDGGFVRCENGVFLFLGVSQKSRVVDRWKLDVGIGAQWRNAAGGVAPLRELDFMLGTQEFAGF